MIIGEQRLALEQRMLNRLVVGLMAEGVEVTRIVPEGLPLTTIGEGEQRMALARRIEARMRALPWMRKVITHNTLEKFGEALPDVFYLLGEDAWTFGLNLAKASDRPAIVEIFSADQIPRLPRAGAAERNAQLAAVTAPCAGIAELTRARVGNELTALVPMGVGIRPALPRTVPDSEHLPSIAVLGSARDLHAYATLLNGLAIVARERPGIQIFIELRGPYEHDIWTLAERSGIISTVSTIGSATQHHALMTRCDLAIWPEPFGELRTIMLETMAMATPIIAVANPALDMLQHERTAIEIKSPTANAWASEVLDLMADQASSARLGQCAREHVMQFHRSSSHIASLCQLIDTVGGKDAFTFPTQ